MKYRFGGFIAVIGMASAADAQDPVGAAHLGHRIQSLSSTIDMVWVLIAATLVMMMQVGFMLLESGSVRTKNAVSVAQKNLLDFAFSTVVFATVGFGLAFGAATTWLPVGTSPSFFSLDTISRENAIFFIFQVMFCGTAATIVSGAVAERMRLRAYITLCIFVAGLVYPVFTHWAWGDALGPSSGAFLANAGFVDFAGSTVVHATGGWFALAACIVLGARDGRFTHGPAIRFSGHSAVLASAGALFLFIGWVGFNGGSTLAASPAVPGIILNTVLAGAAGGVVGYGTMWFGGAMLPERAVNGVVGGLVAITAGCHLVSPNAALLLGALGGVCANGANYLMESRFRIDDAVGAVGVHAVSGVIGTIGLALLAPVDVLPAGSRLAQVLVQAEGSAINFVWAFGIGLALTLAIRPFVTLRVTGEEEAVGLNAAEHGAKLGTDHLQAAVEFMLEDSPSSQRLKVEAGDDAEGLTLALNSLMDKLQQAESDRAKQVLSNRSAEEVQRLEAFGEVASEGIFLVYDGLIRSANSSAAALFATTVEALVGSRPEDLIEPEMQPQLRNWLETGADAVHELPAITRDGQKFPIELRLREIEIDGHAVVVLRMTNLSERDQARREIYRLALHDPLTDLPNRELFNRRLEQALEKQRFGTLTALLLVDIDRFKDINDLHGHPAGDIVLSAVAERLLAGVRDCDTVARLGGDEFAVIHTNILFPNQALDLAYRVLQNISQPLALPNGQVIQPRASIGLALSPVDASDSSALMQCADFALYATKNRGRNGFQRYKAEMGRIFRLRQEFEEDLAMAVERGELHLEYQPRIDLESGAIAGFEALLRWTRSGTLVRPEDFIPIAEDSGHIIPMGAWVIREACHTASEVLGGLPVSVNVSTRQFHDPQLIATVSEALRSSGLPAERLELEITESVLIDDDRTAIRTLDALRAMGVRVALDDFGTGYSSLSYLTRFTFDTIKIDRSFIRLDDERTWQVMRSVLQMSTMLSTTVVAEGVETQEQLDRLMLEGCHQIQGFLVSRPIPAGDAARKIVNGRWESFQTKAMA
ncbi:ammonium transporter [Novosphingobium aquimarinum]|uniref:ammonium transporter n=1 Tax=Novosphingobium aquimarinum TaxID=2682494 RepID=UPI0012EB5EAA|nr:ammonium transporter [Novosphingobium aquimarinum]